MTNQVCTHCGNSTASPLMRGSGWIEFIAYAFGMIFVGLIYSIWRRMDPPSVCPYCNNETLISRPIEAPQTFGVKLAKRNESECAWCAEMILSHAKVCKHCGKETSEEWRSSAANNSNAHWSDDSHDSEEHWSDDSHDSDVHWSDDSYGPNVYWSDDSSDSDVHWSDDSNETKAHWSDD